VIDVSADLARLIEEEQSAMKALDEAKKKADEIVREAGTKAKTIIEAAKDESAFRTFVEERSREIGESKKRVIDKAEERSSKLAELAERNLDRAVHEALKGALGSDV
jgi:vacuolar-type H+-ATPase subunit H